MGKCCLHAISFIFIKSSSKLLVTRTGLIAQTSLISGQIKLLTSELLALECRKFYTFEFEYLWGQLANLDQILCVASLGVGKGWIMLWSRLAQNSGVHGNRKRHWLIMGKLVSPAFLGCICFDPFFFYLAGNKDMHKILDKSGFRPDRTSDYGVSCPWASKKFPIYL